MTLKDCALLHAADSFAWCVMRTSRDLHSLLSHSQPSTFNSQQHRSSTLRSALHLTSPHSQLPRATASLTPLSALCTPAQLNTPSLFPPENSRSQPHMLSHFSCSLGVWMAPRLVLFLVTASVLLLVEARKEMTFSWKLIHRFSDEAKAVRVSRNVTWRWPEKKSMEYYEMLLNSDFQRQKMKLGPHYQSLFPAQGSKTMSLGDDFGWLHYTWIDVGTPSVSFLVALDSGSDLLWIPCNCVQCAPLSASYYSALDRDLNEYSPSHSSSSKHVSCSHELCELGSNCKTTKQPCPYHIDYYSENTSSSGLLVEDILHLASGGGDTSNSSVQAPVIVGCGMKQSGGYLDGIAPDGLMGLGMKDISVPSILAKAGLIRNSFSMCFDDNDAGRILFGDQGRDFQQSTPFLTLDGDYSTYIVGVEATCVGSSCPQQTSFRVLVDSGTSFTFLPNAVFEVIAKEFDQQVNATISSFEGYPWKYCYSLSSSQDSPKVPSVKLMFPGNNSFIVHDPVFKIYGIQGMIGFCLAIQPADGDIGTIGQNFMTGYKVVFDRESLKLGWSYSNCREDSDGKQMPLSHPKQNPLPTNEQQSTPGGRAVSPAVAGRAPSKPSSAPAQSISSRFCLLKLLPLLLLLHLLVILSSK